MLLFNKTLSYAHSKKSIGFNILLLNSAYKKYTKELNFSMNIGYKVFSLRLFWGKAKLAPGYEQFNNLIPEVSKVICYDSDETVLLRENKEYTIRKVFLKNLGDGFLYPQLSFMELDEKFDYPAVRFMPKQKEDWEE